MADWGKYLADHNVGEWVSLVALLLTFVGFGITIYNVVKAKQIAIKLRKDLSWTDAVGNISKSLTMIAEIKRLHRMQAWDLLTERYAELRTLLIKLKSNAIEISDDQKVILQRLIGHLRKMEDDLERAGDQADSQIDIAKSNKTLSRQADNLTELLGEIKAKIGV